MFVHYAKGDIMDTQQYVDENCIYCPVCDSTDHNVLGAFGKYLHLRCGNCGIDFRTEYNHGTE